MACRTRYRGGAALVYRALIDPLLRPLRPKIVRLCEDLGVDSVLDIACATGAQCRALGRAGVRATGLDLSADMMASARRLGGRLTSYVQGSAYDVPFEARSFDVALLILALHEHTEAERRRMLAEAARVSRRFVIIADYEPPDTSRLHLAWQAIRLIEHVAGGEHRAGFRDFVRGEALSGLLNRNRLLCDRSAASHFGTIRVVVLDRSVFDV